MTITLRLISALTICSLLFGANLNAQSAWLPPSDGNSITVEAYRLNQPSFIFLDLFSSSSRIPNGTALFITARFQQRAGLTFLLEIPVARSDENTFFNIVRVQQNSQTAIGNPYLGLSLKGNKSLSVTLDAGFRLPFAPKGMAIARTRGIEADFDRWEAFATEQVSARVLIGGRWTGSEISFTTWIKSGGTLLVPNSSTDTEFLFDYQVGLWFTAEKAAFGSTFIGRTLLTESGPSFTKRSEFLMGFGANLTIGSLRPGVNIRFPLSDNGLFFLGSSVDAIYGANITYLFGGNDKKESDWR